MTTSKLVLDPLSTEHDTYTLSRHEGAGARGPSFRGHVAVTVRYREFDGLDSAAVGPSVGVRPSLTKLLTYELRVIASDVADMVRSSGGWMYDRVRAGWRVTALVPSDADIRPLKILGVRALPFETEYLTERTPSPAAFAVASEVFERDARVRRDIQHALLRGRTEVTFWGNSSSHELDCRIGEVRHRLSGAARAFKTRELIAMSPAHPGAGPTEEFGSAAMWYPPNGVDLAPIV